MRNQLRGTAIPKTKQHQFKCGLVVNGFRPEHPLVFLWPRLQRKKIITIIAFKQFSPLCNCFLFAKQTKLAGIRHPEWPYPRMPDQREHRLLNIICPVRHLALSKSYCIFFVLLISMQHGLTVQVKENLTKKRTTDAFKQYN